MRALRGLALGLLVPLLLLALVLFGLALQLRLTLLSPRFVAGAIGRLDVAGLLEEGASSKALRGMPKELRAAISGSLDRLGPEIEQRLRATLDSAYDYLRGRKERPDLAAALGATFLDSGFVSSVVDAFDITAIAGPGLKSQLIRAVPPEQAWARSYLDENLDGLLAELSPLVKEDLKSAAGPVAEFLQGKRRSFSLAIQTKPLLAVLREDLRRYATDHPVPVPKGSGFSSSDEAIDEVFARLASAVPAAYRFDASVLGSSVPAQIASAISAAEKGLAQARTYVHSFRVFFWILAGSVALFSALIALVYRRVTPTTRTFGILLVIAGVVVLAVLLAGRSFFSASLARLPGIIPSLGRWLEGLLNSYNVPGLAFGIGCAASGAALVVISVLAGRWGRGVIQQAPQAGAVYIAWMLFAGKPIPQKVGIGLI